MRFNLITIVLALCIVLSLSSCKKPDTDTGSSPNSSDYETEATLLTNSFIDNLETDLLAAGYSQNQADIITEEAKSQIYIDEAGQTTDISLIAPCIVKGAQLSLSISNVRLATSDEKLQAIEVIIASITSSLDGKISDTSASMAPESSRNVSAGKPLYVSSATYSNVFQQIVATSITYLDDAGIENLDIVAAVKAVVKNVSCNLTRAGVRANDMASVAKSITTSAVGALDDAGVSSSDMSDAIKAITSGALTGLKEDGQTTAIIAAVSDDITEGTILGLKEAGVSDSEIDSMITVVKTGVNDGLFEAGLTSDEIDAIQTDIEEAANAGRDGLSLKSFLSFQFLAANNTALSVDVNGVINSTDKTISLIVPYGTNVTSLIATWEITGKNVSLGGLKQKNSVSANDYSDLVELIVSAPDGSTTIYTVSVSQENIFSVVSSDPENNATGIAPNTTVSATFNLDLDCSSITTATFSLKDESNNTIPGSITCSGKTATYTPSNNLIYYTYTVTAGTSIVNYAGAQLPNTQSWDFTISTKLPDTGQAGSYTTTLGEDSDYSINMPSYTDNGNGTVTDNNTNFMWQQTDDDASRDYQAAIDYCDSLALAGHTDWRLPQIKELATLFNFGDGRGIDTIYFTDVNNEFWSATTIPTDTSMAIRVRYQATGTGVRGQPLTKTNQYYCRCVRGKMYPNSSLQDNGDETVTDLTTGLIWSQYDGGLTSNAETNMTICEDLTTAGKNDWRLPTLIELMSLVDFSTTNFLDLSFFPNANAAYYTTSTYQSNGAGIQLVSFSSGTLGTGGGQRTRCVRGAE